jgi:hypothetical protein
MNAMQIEFCADNILERMWMYSLEEVQLVLDNGAAGIYGPLYNRIDPATILDWFPKYDYNERRLVVETNHETQKQENNLYAIFEHPQINEAMHQVADKMKIKEAPQPEAKRVAPSAFEQQLMNEYNELPQWTENKWFRVYQNKPYQFDEYRKQRYMEEIDNQKEY